MTRKKPAVKPKTARGNRASITESALALMRDRRQPVQRRAPVAISFLKTPEHRATAAKALEAMADEPSLTPRMLARIFKAMHRYVYRPAAAQKRKSKSQLPPLGKKAAAQAAALAPSKVDLSGPCTMAITMDPELFERWQELHFNDPGEVYARRRGDIQRGLEGPMFIPSSTWDALNQLPDDAKLAALDEVVALAPKERPSP